MPRARDRLALGLSVLAGVLFVSYLGLARIDERGAWGEPVFPAGLTLAGFVANGPDSFTSVADPSGSYILAHNVSMVSDALYDVRFVIDAVPAERIRLHVDFYGAGFDEPSSEAQLRIGEEDVGHEVRAVLPVVGAPPVAMLRVFYSGAPGLRVSNLRVSRSPGWLLPTLTFVWWFSIGLGVVVVLFVLADDESRLWANLEGYEPSPRNGGVVVLAVYGVSVVLRFLQYRATPYWSGDEYVYKGIAAAIWEFGSISQLRSEHIANIVDLPNLIYPHLVAPAFAFGEDFYSAIRLINALVMSAAIFPAYAIARRFWGVAWAVPLAAFSICVPAMGLGAYVTTETLFYPILLAVAWATIRVLADRDGWTWHVLVGALIAVAMNVRPTGTFLIPAYFAALAVYALYRGEAARLYRRPTWLLMLVAFVVLHLCLQWSFRSAASEGIGLYAEILGEDRITTFFRMLEEDPSGPLRLFLGHLLTLAVPYALPVALLGVGAPHLRRLFLDRPAELAIVVVAAVFSGVLVGATLVFTLYSSTFDLGGIDRWHARYYFPASPLLLLAAAVLGRRLVGEDGKLRTRAIVVAALVLLLGGLALFGSSIPHGVWFGSIVDDMDVQWQRYWPHFYLLFGAIMLGAGGLWARRRPSGLRLLVSGLVLWIVVAWAGVATEARVGEANSRVACGRGLARLVADSSARLGVFGRNRAEIVGIGFWMPRTPTVSHSVRDVSEIERAIGDYALEWVVVHEGFSPPAGARELHAFDGCRLYSVEP